jgi:hypothetical protein
LRELRYGFLPLPPPWPVEPNDGFGFDVLGLAERLRECATGWE